MDTLPFVDTHFHSFDLAHGELEYEWLMPGVMHPNLGDIDGIKSDKYLVEHFVAESRHSNVIKAVHVEADISSGNPVTETAWLEEAAERTGMPNAIVADADLKDPHVGDILELHARHSRVRGIRDFSYGDFLVEESFHRGYALLERHGLLFDVACVWEDMSKLGDLAQRFPGIPVVLEHAGFPQQRSAEYFENWRRGLRQVAAAPNTVVKISGLGMGDPWWSVESLRPWVLECIEAFGIARAFFGTNWPVDRLYSSYADVINAYRTIIADFADDERQALLATNAERVYRI